MSVGLNPAQTDTTAEDYITLITTLPDTSWVLVPKDAGGANAGKTVYEKITVADFKAAVSGVVSSPVAAQYRRDGLLNLTTNTTLTKADEGKFVACSGTITITLPDLSPTPDTGFFIRFVKSGASGTVTIDAHGSGTINGAANYQLTDDLESVYLKYNGDSGGNNIWAVVSRSKDTDTKPAFIAEKTAVGATYVDISSDTYQDGDILAITAKETSGNIIPRTVIERWEDIIDGTWIYITFESGKRFQIRKSGNKLQAQTHVISSTNNKITVFKLN